MLSCKDRGWELMHVAAGFQPVIRELFAELFICSTWSDLPCQRQLQNKRLAESACSLHCESKRNQKGIKKEAGVFTAQCEPQRHEKDVTDNVPRLLFPCRQS